MLAFLHLDCGKGSLSLKAGNSWHFSKEPVLHTEELAPGKMTLLHAPEIIRH